jgi:hypothetical protein
MAQLNPNPIAFAPVINRPEPIDTESIDFESRINSELEALAQAVDSYQADKDENGQSKIAKSLLEAKLEVNRIMAELTVAQNRFKALEAAGTSLDIFNTAVNRVEGGLQKLVQLYQTKVQSQVIKLWFGGNVDLSNKQTVARHRCGFQGFEPFENSGGFMIADAARKPVLRQM